MTGRLRSVPPAVRLAFELLVVASVVTSMAAMPVASAPPDDPHDPLLLQPTPKTVNGQAGEIVTVRLMLLNRGNNTSDAPVVDVGSLPANWTVVDRSDDHGLWRDSTKEWYWPALAGEEKVRPSLSVKIPNGTPAGTYTLNAEVTDGNGHADTATVRLKVTPAGPKDDEKAGKNESDNGKQGEEKAERGRGKERGNGENEAGGKKGGSKKGGGKKGNGEREGNNGTGKGTGNDGGGDEKSKTGRQGENGENGEPGERGQKDEGGANDRSGKNEETDDACENGDQNGDGCDGERSNDGGKGRDASAQHAGTAKLFELTADVVVSRLPNIVI